MWAAFDIGSGSVKVLVARVGGGRLEAALEAEEEVLVKRDVQRHGRVTGATQAHLQTVLHSFIVRAAALGAPAAHWVGAATAAFREADNGEEVCRRLGQESGIRIRVVTQAEESVLGLLTARILSGLPECASIDFGGASFQVCLSESERFEGSWGSVSAWKELLRIQGKHETASETLVSPNPVSPDEFDALIDIFKRSFPPDRPSNICKKPVVAIGGKSSVFNMLRLALKGSTSFSAQDARRIIQEHLLNKSDNELQSMNAEFVQVPLLVGKIALFIAVLEVLDVSEPVAYFPCSGSCPGIILRETGDA